MKCLGNCRFAAALTVLVLFASSSSAIVIVDDNFNSYTSAANFGLTWRPDTGNGNTPAAGPIGVVVPCIPGDPCPAPPFDGSGAGTTPPVSPLPPGDQAISFNAAGGINEWDNDGTHTNVPFSIAPSPTQSIRLQADIFDFVNGNRRFSVGLRNDVSQLNLLELGFWNANTFDPTDPINAPPNVPVNNIPTTAYGYRIINWGPFSPPLVRNPNWQYFPLDIAFDNPLIDHNGDGRVGDGNGLVTPIDVGPGWHRFAATITDTDVTVTLDLFRDGSVDSTVTWPIRLANDPNNPGNYAPFTSLRMGGPSGVSMNQPTMVDNVRLEILTGSLPGDFNGDSAYNCLDIDALVGIIAGGSNNPAFDLNGDNLVNRTDLDLWLGIAGNANIGPGRSYLYGDANLDGTVNNADFTVWFNSRFTNTAAWCSGDFNADGKVDGPDFGEWNRNKGLSSILVPEPMGLAWVILMAILATSRRAAIVG